METLVNMAQKSFKFGCDYFTNQEVKDNFFDETTLLELAILQCTYPEYESDVLKDVCEDLYSDMSAKEILAKHNLPNRDDRMKQLSEILEPKSKDERIEMLLLERMKRVDPEVVHRYIDLKAYVL